MGTLTRLAPHPRQGTTAKLHTGHACINPELYANQCPRFGAI